MNLPVAYVLDHSHSLAAITQHVKELVRCAVAAHETLLQPVLAQCNIMQELNWPHACA